MGLDSAPQNRLTYVFDLDGVIYRGNELQPHARQLILALRDQAHTVRFFTNNAALSRTSYVEKLSSLGIPVAAEEIMTSSYATALYFVENHAAGKTVYRIGEDGMREELEAVGMRVLYDQQDPTSPIDYVVVGLDRHFQYRKLARAQRAIHSGAQFIATNPDLTFPVESGALLPGAGSLVEAVRAATSVDPFVIGKPATYALNKILEITSTSADRAVIIGDRLDTDIRCGNRAGTHTVLVLTGVTGREQAESATGEDKPERIIADLGELLP